MSSIPPIIEGDDVVQRGPDMEVSREEGLVQEEVVVIVTLPESGVNHPAPQ